MVQRVKCPCCGILAWPSQLKRSYELETFDVFSLGKAHGFRLEPSDDTSMAELMKLKIKALYQKFFPDEILPRVAVSMIPQAMYRLRPHVRPSLNLRSQILIHPKLR